MNPKTAAAVQRVLAALEPPEDMLLADWAEKNIVIPQGQSARPGPTKMWPYLIEPLNAIGDRSIERVTVQKSARVGMTKCLIFAIAARASTDPCPIIFLCPRDEDSRGMAVDELVDRI
jgi:phage terminase large subunit GpA-like protein